MAILTRSILLERLLKEDLVVTPLLTEDQVGDASIDVRLGNEFLVPMRVAAGVHQYHTVDKASAYLPVRRDFREPLFLHPGQLVLGATFEFLQLPDNLSCYVIGRSSFGRAGLVIATATAVAPGYGGCITLEIVNIGAVPVPLYAGIRIAQLVFHDTVGTAMYKGRFAAATGPMPPTFSRDWEKGVWVLNDGEVAKQ